MGAAQNPNVQIHSPDAFIVLFKLNSFLQQDLHRGSVALPGGQMQQAIASGSVVTVDGYTPFQTHPLTQLARWVAGEQWFSSTKQWLGSWDHGDPLQRGVPSLGRRRSEDQTGSSSERPRRVNTEGWRCGQPSIQRRVAGSSSLDSLDHP